jgi:nucleotide-binding universal stress UspA family protein
MCVVVGYVATPEGEAALEAGLVEAARRDTTLRVVVGATSSWWGMGGTPAVDLDALTARLGAQPVPVEVVPTEGHDVADEILAVAADRQADLVVLGLRRRALVGKLVLGPNAQRILLDAPCPVLTVKPSTD